MVTNLEFDKLENRVKTIEDWKENRAKQCATHEQTLRGLTNKIEGRGGIEARMSKVDDKFDSINSKLWWLIGVLGPSSIGLTLTVLALLYKIFGGHDSP